MQKIIRTSLLLGLMTLSGAGGVFAQSGSGAADPAPEEKSVGTASGEAARDFKVQAEDTLKKFQDSTQVLLQKIQEEIRKFNEAYNKPKPPAPAS